MSHIVAYDHRGNSNMLNPPVLSLVPSFKCTREGLSDVSESERMPIGASFWLCSTSGTGVCILLLFRNFLVCCFFLDLETIDCWGWFDREMLGCRGHLHCNGRCAIGSIIFVYMLWPWSILRYSFESLLLFFHPRVVLAPLHRSKNEQRHQETLHLR